VTLDVDLVASMLESAGKMAMPIGGAAPQLGQAQPNAAAPGFPQPTPPTATFPTPNLNPPVRSFPPANQLNRGNALAKVGAAAGREQASNNLRQIALALQQYVDGKGHFPPPAIVDSQGKPLLSWRVAILPNLGVNEGNLYKQFHLDEPWDSPANKRLLIRMPNVYRSPRGKNLGFGKTAMLVPLGQREAFYGRQQRKLRDFSDGTSNTILVVEAAPDRAVEWTKPDDLPFDEGDAAAGLFGQRDGGFLAAFADGTVKFIPQSIDKNILLALFTINGGETIPPDFDVKP
jgi:type II secretory pathway pseudopilin PulG